MTDPFFGFPQKNKWTPPPVKREGLVNSYPVIDEVYTREKTFLRLLGFDEAKEPDDFKHFRSFLMEFADSLVRENVPVPVDEDKWCGLADLLEWGAEIKAKIGDETAKKTLKQYLAPFFADKKRLCSLVRDFAENPPISHLKSFRFARVGKKTICFRILEPSYFAKRDSQIHFLRDLLPTGGTSTYGSGIAFSWNSYGRENTAKRLSVYRDKIADYLNGNGPGKSPDLTAFGLDSFIELDMDEGDRKILLQNAMEVTDALIKRAKLELSHFAVEMNLTRFKDKISNTGNWEILAFPNEELIACGEWLAEVKCGNDPDSSRLLSMEMKDNMVSVTVDGELVCEAERAFFESKNFADFVESLEIPEPEHNPAPSMGM